MIRMQIQLTDEQAAELRRRAHAQHVSIAAVVREAVDRELQRDVVQRPAWERALEAVGKHRSGTKTTSVDHDAVLDEMWGR